MKFYKTIAVLVMVTTLWLAAPAIAARGGHDHAKGYRHGCRQSAIIQTLQADGRFNTLLVALETAGLTDTLANDGPFTVLAPTDAAFSKLDPGTLQFLLDNPEQLKQILLYHVLSGYKQAARLLFFSEAQTLLGAPVLFLAENRQVLVNRVAVEQANMKARNGIIHVIGGVLLPPEDVQSVESIVDILRLDGRFSTLLAALHATGLDKTLADRKQVTLLAPTDEAFGKLPAGTITTLLAEPELLSQILLYHVIDGRQGAIPLLARRTVKTLQGAAVAVSYRSRVVYVNDSTVINVNVRAPNGIVHSLDTVLTIPE